jgi:PAS domain S-box-containing protein
METQAFKPLLLLLTDDQARADRLIKALSPDGYRFQRVALYAALDQLSDVETPELAIIWFPYSSPEALPELESLVLAARILGGDDPLPVLLIIDQYGEHWVEPGFRLGVTDILTRPIHPLVLRRRANLLLQARQTEQAMGSIQRSEQALRDERQRLFDLKERFRTVADFTYDWEYWIDHDGNLIYNSPACERITGRPAQAFVDRPSLLLDIVHPDDFSMVKEHFQNERTAQLLGPLDFRILTGEGEERWIGHVCQPVSNSQGQPTGRRISNRDITEHRLAEHAALRSERLAVMGRLLASLAHEINNPLQAMYSNIELAMDFPIESDERHSCLQIVREETERLMKIIRDILEFSRPRAVTREAVPVAAFIEHALTLARKQLLSANIRVSLDLPGDLPQVCASLDQLEQVCLNLVINASEHMSAVGKLDISARSTDGQVQIAFSDNGEGIPASEIEWIFDPFYTSKANGTGLGLAISQSIVQRHGGQITVQSTQGKGTTFIIHLPVAGLQP